MATDRFNGVLASKAIKVPVRRATNVNQTLSGDPGAIDGYTFTDGERILLYGQTDPVENGIWEIDTISDWSRAPDFDGNRDATTSTLVTAERSAGNPVMYILTNSDPVDIGSDALTFQEYFDPDNPASPTLQQVTDVGNQTTDSIFIGVKAAAETDRPAFGQIWVRNDVPPVLVYRDDQTNEFVLGESNVNDGTADGQMTYWDQTGTQKYLATNSMSWDETARYLDIRADEAFTTPPTGGTPGGGIRIYDTDGTDQLATVAFNGSNLLEIRNFIYGASIFARAAANDGTPRTLFSASPEGNFDLYSSGLLQCRVESYGLSVRGSLTNDPTSNVNQDGQIQFQNLNGANTGFVGHDSPNTTGLMFVNECRGGDLDMRATTTAGALSTFLQYDPDGDCYVQSAAAGRLYLRYAQSNLCLQGAASIGGVRLYNNLGEYIIQGQSRASGGVIIMNDLTHGTAGTFQRALTESDMDTGRFDIVSRFSSNTTSSDPGAGFFKFNNADYSLVTEIYVDDTNKYNNNVEKTMSALASGDLLNVGCVGTPLVGTLFLVGGAATDNTGWWTIPVSYVSGSTSGMSTAANNPGVISPVWQRAGLTSGFANTGWELRGLGNTDSEDRKIEFTYANSTVRTWIGTEASDGNTWKVKHELDGGIQLTGVDSESSQQLFFAGGLFQTLVRGESSVVIQVGGNVGFETAAIFNLNGSSDIYYNNSKKLETTNLGIAVTGSLYIKEESAAQANVSGQGQLYVKSDASGNLLYFRSEIGATERVGVQVRFKTGDESITNSTAMQDDNDLAGWDVRAGEYYEINGYLPYTQNGGDIKLGLTYTTALTVRSYTIWAVGENGSNGGDSDNSGADMVITSVTDGEDAGISLRGMVVPANNGTAKLQWAQNSSSANATTVRQGAWITFRRVSPAF